MAGRQQTLNTTIVISGKVDNSFTRLGSGLMELGSTIDILGAKVRDYTQDSVSMYADYDDTLRAIQGKLGDASMADMSALNEQMRAWAETTRYTATEVSGAVDEAAAAGWTLEEIYGGMPEVMNLAAAANLDLVTSMEYLNSGIAGMGLELSDSEELIDQWVKTANVGRTSVDDIGKSFEALGSVMTFTESPEELLTLLTIMGEYGTKGAEAGTLLRNVMLRLVAPTDKASAALELLGASADEISELEAADLGNAAERMEQLGLSAFDSEGNLKSIIAVVDELRSAVAGMSEDEMYDVLYDIFPTRTIRGIMDLMRSTPAEYESVMRQIVNSDGYAEWVAQLQEGGIGGALREARSKLDEFKLTYGEALSDDVEMWADLGGNILSFLSDLPEDKINALSKMAGTLAIVGPTLMGIGAAVKVIGMVSNPYLLAAAGISVLAVGIHELAESAAHEDIAENFGTMSLDADKLNDHLFELNSEFRAGQSAVDGYSAAVDAAIEDYKTTSEKLSGSLLTASITGETLSATDRARIDSQVAAMHAATIEALDKSFAESGSYWEMVFGGAEAASGNENYIDLMSILGSSYTDTIAQAEEISQNMRKALSSALSDDTITAEEYNELLAYFEQYNALIAKAEKEARNKEEWIQKQMLLEDAQTASYDELSGYAKDMVAQRDAAVAEAENDAAREYWNAVWDANSAVEAGLKTEDQAEEAIAGAETAQKAYVQSVKAGYDDDLMRLWESGLAGSELWDVYQSALEMSGRYGAGEIAGHTAADELRGMHGAENVKDVANFLHELVGYLGGAESITDRIGMYTENGQSAMATELRRVLDASLITSGWALGYSPNAAPNGAQLNIMPQMPETIAETAGYLNQQQAYADSHPIYFTVRARSDNALSAAQLNRFAEYAEGGRATEASIFGEAGAEWAIPEAHTARTASLLNAARAASGFSWGELISQTGGGTGASSQLVYSPTIIVRDAEGVDAVLQRNKDDFRRWFEEKQLRDSMEVYV